jgi:hypothetical protein
MSQETLYRIRLHEKAYRFLASRGHVYIILPYRRRSDREVVEVVLYKRGRARDSMLAECTYIEEYIHTGPTSYPKLEKILPETGCRSIKDLINTYHVRYRNSEKYDVPNIYYIYKLEKK